MTRNSAVYCHFRNVLKTIGILNLSLFVILASVEASTAATTKAGTVSALATLVRLGSPSTTSSAKVGYNATPPIAPPVGNGNTYYVSDPSNPVVDLANRLLLPLGATVFPTVQAAANVTNPGDTVLVMNGTYVLNPSTWVVGVLTITRSGSATGGYITYAAYPGAHPILTTSNSFNTWDVIAVEANYIVIEGFELVGSAQKVTLAFATQTSAAGVGVLQREAAAGQPAATPTGPAKWETNGNCIGSTSVAHVMIIKNLVHDCSAAGIDFEKSDYITVEANTVYNTSWWTIYDTSGISLHLSLNSDSSTGYKNFVLANISYDNANTQPFMYDTYNNFVHPGTAPQYPTDGNGIIIDTNQSTNDGSPYLGRTLVAGNIAYNNGGSGIHAYLSNHVDIINNTAYMNDTCPVAGSTCGAPATIINGVTVSGNVHGQIYAMSGSDNNIYNNVLYAPAGKYISTDYNNTSEFENNNILYSATGQIILGGYKPAANDITSNPLFLNATAPAQDDFQFRSNSPGINAGFAYSNQGISVPALLGLPMVRGEVDIGAPQ